MSPVIFDHLDSKKKPVFLTVLGILDHSEEPPKRIGPSAHRALFSWNAVCVALSARNSEIFSFIDFFIALLEYMIPVENDYVECVYNVWASTWLFEN